MSIHEGILKHNESERLCFDDGYYFTSGDPIEIYDEDSGGWIKGRIEYSHKYHDYYFYEEVEEIYIYDLAGKRARSI